MILNFWIWMITLIHLALSDNRCFLENGGSSESFFVSESLPVNSVIGVLKIHGDPSEQFGDITLKLHRPDSPVKIAKGSKNLTLARQLDKEGIIGPSSVYVNILCERRGLSSDPGYVIPVNIRVTDANDNAPEFINGPYVLNISEVTVIGTRVLQGIRAVDKDQQGPFSTVQYSVIPGPYSDYFVFLNALEGTLILRKSLDYELISNFTIKIRAQDQGSPPRYTDAEVKINVIDADDQNPRFLTERYSAVLPLQPTVGSRVRLMPYDLVATDQDKGINSPVFYSFNSDGADYQLFDIEPATGVITIAKEFEEDDLNQPATLVVRATQVDNKDRYALSTVTISRKGAIQALHFLQKLYIAGVLENAPVNSVVLTAVTNRPRDRRVRQWLEKDEGVFGVNNAGDITLLKPLDYEARDIYVFRVHATDGRVNDTALINITVLNVNDWDPRFRYPQYEFFVAAKDLRPGHVVGKIEVADGDRGDRLTLTLRGPHAHLFRIKETGELSIASLQSLNSSDAHVVAIATDSGLPPRQTSVPITIHFPNEVVSAAKTLLSGGENFLMITVFSSLLILLLLIIIALGVYIHKGKRKKRVEDTSEKSNSSSSTDCKTSDSSSLSPNIIDMEGRMFNVGTLPLRNPQYTATVKSIMSRAGSSRSYQTAKNRIAPTPPQIPEEQECTCSLGSREWMEGSIPRRVKKLSWDDDNDENENVNDNIQGGRTLGKNSSVVSKVLSENFTCRAPSIQRVTSSPDDNVKLTVYF
ncbi:hypothetical protein RUM44_004006 [Polyplax serrata]|uniref:Cadherin domain-containing protein n=1 Tax=Polyplax serrata TaxID=468196 RepID=A0ABR1B1M4_POLSC